MGKIIHIATQQELDQVGIHVPADDSMKPRAKRLTKAVFRDAIETMY